MKRVLFLSLGVILFSGSVRAQVILIKHTDLKSIISTQHSDLTIVNFWATWCGPCVKEMPYFEEANTKKNIRVILVSLDFPQDIEKVNSLAKNKGLQSALYLLDEKDYEPLMLSVSDSWSGAIPATLMIDKNGKRFFYERAFSRDELFEEINKITD